MTSMALLAVSRGQKEQRRGQMEDETGNPLVKGWAALGEEMIRISFWHHHI